MLERTPLIALVAVLVGAGVYAFRHTDSPASPPAPAPALAEQAPVSDVRPLPPGHPPIGESVSAAGGTSSMRGEDSAAALTWARPAGWNDSTSPSTMRLATYRIPRAKDDAEAPELSVVRAGGSADANIQRWIGQFDDVGKDARTLKKLRGMTATVVELRGTFLGGGMVAGAAPAPRPGWALLAAIVETPGSPYFFKMTGPVRSVDAARPAFDALLASVTPVSP